MQLFNKVINEGIEKAAVFFHILLVYKYCVNIIAQRFDILQIKVLYKYVLLFLYDVCIFRKLSMLTSMDAVCPYLVASRRQPVTSALI